MAPPIFNPFKEDVRSLLIKTFEAQPLMKLPPDHIALGCGVYALFYRGDFAPYLPLRKQPKIPVYIGKAVIPGGRKGGGDSAKNKSNFVIRRLKEHAKSISASRTIRLEDFECRWLLVVPEFTNAAESILIDHYQPIWNRLLPGFGIHHPGKGRMKQARSEWDTLHPGRSFAAGLPNGKPVQRIVAAIGEYFSRNGSRG